MTYDFSRSASRPAEFPLRTKRELRSARAKEIIGGLDHCAQSGVQLLGGTSMGRQLRVLIIVENLPVPFDRRVWSEATTLRDAGHAVSVICPKGPRLSAVARDHRRHSDLSPPLPVEARGAAAYFIEYPIALFWEFLLSLKSLAAPRLRRDPRLQSRPISSS